MFVKRYLNICYQTKNADFELEREPISKQFSRYILQYSVILNVYRLIHVTLASGN